MREVDNYCVGCALPCIHCGREKDVIHYSCDSCGADNIDGETTIYSDGANHFCLPCLVRAHMSEFIEYAVDNFSEEFAADNYEEVGDSDGF